jgi:hypothetical protein
MTTAHAHIRELLVEWQALRIIIAEMDVAEHPDIVDALGRVWTWIPGGSGNLYGHDGMAWPREHVERPDVGLPSSAVLANPNYSWCELCRQPAGRLGIRRVPMVTVELPAATAGAT